MSKTLRIISVLAAICIVLLVVLPVVFGSAADEQMLQLLESPGIIETFKDFSANTKNNDEDSPLVKQARAFALFLNPPPPPEPIVRKPIESSPREDYIRPSQVSAKFDLIATSFYPMRPEMSLALIDQPGKGLRWIRQSGQVEHLIIEQIKDGLIVVRDGGRTYEIAAERSPTISLIKGENSAGQGYSPKTFEAPAPQARQETAFRNTGPRSRTARADRRITGSKAPVTNPEEPEIDPAELAKWEQLLEESENMSDEQWLNKAEELISGMDQGENISPEEASQLDQLGQELQDSNQNSEE